MSQHPTQQTLEGFLRSGLPARDMKATVVHLLHHCDQCWGEMAPLATVMFKPDSAPEPELNAEEDAAYERSISAAFSTALATERSLAAEREEAERWVGEVLRTGVSASAHPATWGFCEILIEKSRELRFTDREGMLRLADLARHTAERVDPTLHGDEQRKDLEASAWTELANAQRLMADLAQAAASITRAQALRQEGTGDPLLYARIADVSAALYCDQRRFPETFRMLDLAYAIYRSHGDPHEAGRVLIMKGLYTGYAGNPEEAIQLLARGLASINQARDARLVFYALHNILLFRVELGEIEAATLQLQRMRPLYARHADPTLLTKLRGIEGQIAAGLGNLERAEELLVETRSELEAADRVYLAAIISLDLAGVRLQRGKTAEVRTMVAELVATFQALGVAREAMAAVLMLRESLELDQASLEIVQKVTGILRRVQNEPASRAHLDAL
jgi:tetratricopeptide (TPR) repeat protein